MRSRQALLLSVLALAVVGLLGAGAWWVLGHDATANGAGNGAGPVPLPGNLAPAPEPQAAAPRAPLEALNDPSPSLQTTVAFPLEVDLDLERADAVVQAQGVPVLGSAATARLRGSVFSGVDQPVMAEISVEAGPNAGRVLQCDSSGKFGANDLYPGLMIVRVRGPGVPGSLRVVRLRQERETQLNIGYGRLAEIFGEVLTREGNALPGAKVSFDGQETESDVNGVFHFERVASGQALVVVTKQGYASIQEELAVQAGGRVEKGRIKYAMDKGARLTIELADRIRTDVQAQVFLLSEKEPGSQRTYPWFLVNPVRVWPGGTTTVEDLPAGSIALRLFHAGAVAKPVQKSVRLDAEGEAHVTLNLESAPTIHGIVRMNGQPVQHAEVSLEAADRFAAMLAAFGQSNTLFVESEVLPDAPPAIQRSLTDGAGRYELTSWESAAKERYLVARADGGAKIASKLLRGGETEVDLDLIPSGDGDGALRIALPDRSQPLPVRIRVNGTPRDAFPVPVGQDLHIQGLNQGRWLLSIKWNGETLAAKSVVEIKSDTSFPLELPKGAIEGQDAETRKRAAGMR